MQVLFPLGDVDLLDAYHLCGGRVVSFRASSAPRSPTSRKAAARGDSYRGRKGYRCIEGEEGLSAGGFDENSSGDSKDDVNKHDGGGADRAGAGGWDTCDRGEEVHFKAHGTYTNRDLRLHLRLRDRAKSGRSWFWD